MCGHASKYAQVRDPRIHFQKLSRNISTRTKTIVSEECEVSG